MGIGAIVPGVSGNIMAVAMGYYKGMIDAIADIFKSPRRSIFYLLPLGLGALAGILCTSNLVEWLMSNWREPVLFLFIGLVAGGLQTVVKEGNKQAGFKPVYLVFTVVFAVLLLLFANISGGSSAGIAQISFPLAATSGAVLAVGTIIPGLSVSFLLMHIGTYDALLAALNSFDIGLLAGVGIGFSVTALLLIKLVKLLFDRFSGYAYYSVLGFALASIVVIVPRVKLNYMLIADVILLGAGFLISTVMDNGIKLRKNGTVSGKK